MFILDLMCGIEERLIFFDNYLFFIFLIRFLIGEFFIVGVFIFLVMGGGGDDMGVWGGFGEKGIVLVLLKMGKFFFFIGVMVDMGVVMLGGSYCSGCCCCWIFDLGVGLLGW